MSLVLCFILDVYGLAFQQRGSMHAQWCEQAFQQAHEIFDHGS